MEGPLEGLGRRALAEMIFDGLQENLPLNWFGEIIDASAGDAFGSILGHGKRGQCDDRHLDSTTTQFLRGRVAVEHGHLHVHQNEIEGFRRQSVDRDLPVLRDNYFGSGHT